MASDATARGMAANSLVKAKEYADTKVNKTDKNTFKFVYADSTEETLDIYSVTHPLSTYSIINTLTHVTNSNSATTITEGQSYTGTLTADTGYIIDTVTITMGGVDITSTSYSSGTISINSVTGNIVITASAEQRQIPSTYQQVEYIQSSGTQYIDTGVVQDSSAINVKMTAAYTSLETTYRRLFGSTNGGSIRGVFGTGSAPNKFRLECGSDMSEIDSYTLQTGIFFDAEANFEQNNAFVKINGNTLISVTSTGGTATGQSMPLLCRNKGGSMEQFASVKLKSCEITKGGTLVRYFVPVYRKSDSVAGMYDLVNDVFYENDGTGSFEVGPDVN